jgi:phosphatidyl-myo-inositol dimannoside synthase
MVHAVRLVLVTQDFPPRRGGIQTWALEIAKRLAERCDGFAVIAPSAPETAAADHALGFRVIRSGSSNSLIAAAAPALTRLALREGFTHSLHAQWSTAPLALALRAAGKLRHVTIAVHGRELLLAPWQRMPLAQRAYDRVRQRSLGTCDRILANSRFTAGLVREFGVPDELVRVTHCGTDPEHFRPNDAGELRARHGLGNRPVLLTIARLVPRKAIDLVLRAFALVRTHVPEAMYVIVGDGPDLERLRGLAARFGDAVRFVGPVTDAELPAWYSLGDVFVTPARSEPPDVEGFGIVFLEAAACERAVVAARAGGIPDSVAEGVSGLLITPDDERELAARLVELLLDPARRAELGRRGRERVLAEFTWDRVAERTLAAIGG